MKTPNFTVVVDTREDDQYHYKLEYAPDQYLPYEVGTLYTGDYSIKGLEHYVAIERKALDDLMGCIGTHRDRFNREIQRMLSYPVRALVVEASWQDLESGRYRSRIKSTSAIGSVMGWIAMGIPVIMADNHERAGRWVARMLYVTAKRRYRELKGLERDVV